MLPSEPKEETLRSTAQQQSERLASLLSDKDILSFFRDQLKPLCAQLASLIQQLSVPLPENINSQLLHTLSDLIELLRGSGRDTLPFLDFITFPCLLILEKDFIYRNKSMNGLPTTLLEKTFDCLEACFLNLSTMGQGEKFLALYQSLFIIHITYLDDDNNDNQSKSFSSSEEIKTCLISSFKALLNVKWPQTAQNGALWNLSTVSLFVSKMVDVAVKEKNRVLCELAILTISDILNMIKRIHLETLNVKSIVEAIFPGIISQIAKIIIIPQFVSTRVQSAALHVFSQITCMNCSDVLNNFEEYTDKEKFGSLTSIANLKSLVFSSDERKQKLKEKYEKFEPFLQKVFGIETYSNYASTVSIDETTEIQQAILESCNQILQNCQHTLNDSVPVLVECLLTGGRVIESVEVSSMTEARFLSLLKSIPSICVTTTNEKQKVSSYKLFYHYLEFFLSSTKGKDFISSSLMIPELCMSLMVSLQMDVFNPITEDNTYPRKVFKNFVDDRMVESVFNICKLLGRHLKMDCKKFIDYLFNISFDNSTRSRENSYTNEAILVLNSILEGLQECAPFFENAEKKQLKLFTNSKIELIAESLNEINTNQVETNCLLLETIAILCKFIEKTDKDARDMYLVKVLYPILNQLGYSSIHIKQSCFKTILNIWNHFYDEDVNQTLSTREKVMQLLVNNFDYMIDDIRYRLKYLSIYPHIPRVLNTLFEYNVVSSKIETQKDPSQYINTVTIVDDCIESVFNTIDQQVLETATRKTVLPTLFSILGNIIKTLNVLKKERDFVQIEGKKQLSEKEVETIKAILSKLQHFMNSSQNNLITSVSFISIIENSIIMFENSNIHEFDEETTGNKILPAIHILWPLLLTHLFQKRTPIPLKQRTVELLQVMSVKFHDFLCARISKELLPYLSNSLKQYNQSHITRYKKEPSRMSYYKTEPDYKYIKSILKFLVVILQTPSFVAKIDGGQMGEEGKLLSTTLTPYVTDDAPEHLREISTNIVDLLSKRLISEVPKQE